MARSKHQRTNLCCMLGITPICQPFELSLCLLLVKQAQVGLLPFFFFAFWCLFLSFLFILLCFITYRNFSLGDHHGNKVSSVRRVRSSQLTEKKARKERGSTDKLELDGNPLKSELQLTGNCCGGRKRLMPQCVACASENGLEGRKKFKKKKKTSPFPHQLQGTETHHTSELAKYLSLLDCFSISLNFLLIPTLSVRSYDPPFKNLHVNIKDIKIDMSAVEFLAVKQLLQIHSYLGDLSTPRGNKYFLFVLHFCKKNMILYVNQKEQS